MRLSSPAILAIARASRMVEPSGERRLPDPGLDGGGGHVLRSFDCSSLMCDTCRLAKETACPTSDQLVGWYLISDPGISRFECVRPTAPDEKSILPYVPLTIRGARPYSLSFDPMDTKPLGHSGIPLAPDARLGIVVSRRDGPLPGGAPAAGGDRARATDDPETL